MSFANVGTSLENRVALRPVAPVQHSPAGSVGSVVGGPERFVRAINDDDLESPGTVSPLVHLVHRAGLTSRDLMVLRYLSEGWTTAEIARKLVYAESTIKKEVHIIVQRLGARNRTHAVAMAVRGLVI